MDQALIWVFVAAICNIRGYCVYRSTLMLNRESKLRIVSYSQLAIYYYYMFRKPNFIIITQNFLFKNFFAAKKVFFKPNFTCPRSNLSLFVSLLCNLVSPVSPRSPKTVRKTFASVPAPLTSAV